MIIPAPAPISLRSAQRIEDVFSQTFPTVSDAVGALKRLVNRSLGHDIWQRSFHEHVIRNDSDYREIWEYIDMNPSKWAEDRYYEQCGKTQKTEKDA